MTQHAQAEAAKPNGSLARAALLIGTTGAGAMLLYLLILALRSEPRTVVDMVAQILTTWGPLFALSAMVIYLADKRFGQMIAAHREGAAAMLQVGHCGGFSKNAALGRRGPLGPSFGFNAYGALQGMPLARAMGAEDPERTKQDFVRAARCAFTAGLPHR